MRIKDSGDSRVRGLEYSKTQGLGVLSTRRLGDLSSRGPKDSKFMSYSGIHGDLEIQRLWAPYVLGNSFTPDSAYSRFLLLYYFSVF